MKIIMHELPHKRSYQHILQEQWQKEKVHHQHKCEVHLQLQYTSQDQKALSTPLPYQSAKD